MRIIAHAQQDLDPIDLEDKQDELAICPTLRYYISSQDEQIDSHFFRPSSVSCRNELGLVSMRWT